MKFAAPLAVFVALSAFLALALGRNPRALPSPLIDRPAPGFRLPLLDEPSRSFSPDDARGSVWLLNVWASWCVACRAEHDILAELSRTAGLPIYGLDYKDQAVPAMAFLGTYGNPYRATLQDPDGGVGIAYGVYGVPETYVVDAAGIIRYKHVGALTREIADREILPLVRRLQ